MTERLFGPLGLGKTGNQVEADIHRRLLAQALMGLRLKKPRGRRVSSWRKRLKPAMLEVMTTHPTATYEEIADVLRADYAQEFHLPSKLTIINWLSEIRSGKPGFGRKS